MRTWMLVVAAIVGLALVGGVMLIWSPVVVLASIGGIFSAALVAYLSQAGPKQLKQTLAQRRGRRELQTGVPLSCTACVKDHDYVVLVEDDVTVEVPASGHTAQIVVTSLWPAPVLLTGMRVEIISRRNQYGDLARHAAELPVRRFEVRLDREPPHVTPLTSSDFPFRLVTDESEVFDLAVSTDSGDLCWVLWLDWSSGGRTGSLRVDLDGEPFRTAARYGLPA
jgi:hypothetical protein